MSIYNSNLVALEVKNPPDDTGNIRDAGLIAG